MSEKVTRIRLPGQKHWPGCMEWGEQPASMMIGQARRYAAHLRAQADVIDAALDGHFQIDVVRGTCAQHHLHEVQKAATIPNKERE